MPTETLQRERTEVVQDLTRGEIMALGVLEARGSIRLGQVATALLVDPSVVSRQLAALARHGLVARGTDPDDGRAELISLTDLGRTRLLAARTTMCEALALRLDRWDVEDILRASAVVDDLGDRLHQPVPGPGTAPTNTATTKKDAHA